MRISETEPIYGTGDATFRAVGGEPGIRQLVEYFYDTMESDHSVRPLRLMHADDLSESREKLAAFLSGWMGGPKRYAEKYGSINIPSAHAHLNIDESHAQQWLHCLNCALDKMDYSDSLKAYLFKQLSFPVSRVVQRARLS